MRAQERDSYGRTFRFASVQARSSGAPGVALRPGLNVVVGLSEADRRLLRSLFAGLTEPGPVGLDAMIEVDGTVTLMNGEFARVHGLAGRRPPIVEVALAGPDNLTGAGDPSPSDVRLRELEADERRLTSQLELLGRDLARERELLESAGGATGHVAGAGNAQAGRGNAAAAAGPTGGTAASGFHPADVAVMCDRLRDLLARRAPSEALALAEELEEVAGRRVYAVHRELALAQLMEECSFARASVESFLESPASRPEGAAAEETAAGGDAEPARERVESASMRAQAIARLELLEELAAFWQARQGELDQHEQREAALVDRAVELLSGAGLDTSGGARVLAGRLRSISADHSTPTRTADDVASEERAIRELVGSLAEYVQMDPSLLTPQVLLDAAEARLARGDAAAPPQSPADASEGVAWRSGSADRVSELEEAEHQLTRRLAATRAELAAIERGLRVSPRPPLGSVPNPFGTRDPDRSAAATPDGVPRRAPGVGPALREEVAALREVPGVGTLPVLLIEPGSGPADDSADRGSLPSGPGASVGAHLPAAPDPQLVAEMAAGGQVLWVTDRQEVLDALAGLGDDVGVIRA